MKRTKRSVWHTRSLVGRRSRPRSCPQWLWYFATPERVDPTCIERANGWRGGRDRDKPRKATWRLWVRLRCVGGIAQYDLTGPWIGYLGPWSAYLVESDYVTTVRSRAFMHRRDAKRWVEVESARRGNR